VHAVFDGLPQFELSEEALHSHGKETFGYRLLTSYCADTTIKALGEVIVAHGLQEIAGVSLLHQHFPLASHEVLVERIFDLPTHPHALIRPLPAADLTDAVRGAALLHTIARSQYCQLFVARTSELENGLRPYCRSSPRSSVGDVL
jgi:hypothetical protein